MVFRARREPTIKGNGTRANPLLQEQTKGWSLMIPCARATRDRGLPSPGVRALLSVPVGERVVKLRTHWDGPSRPQNAFVLGRVRRTAKRFEIESTMEDPG